MIFLNFILNLSEPDFIYQVDSFNQVQTFYIHSQSTPADQLGKYHFILILQMQK